MFWKPKKCTTCSMPITFQYGIYDTEEGKRFGCSAKLFLYCKLHFLQKIKEYMPDFKRPFIFYEPKECYPNSQLIYYIPNNLTKDNYSKDDCSDALRILDNAKFNDDSNIILLDSSVVGDVYTEPLFKIKNPDYRIVNKETFVSILSNMVSKGQAKNNKGCFYFCLPYLDRGIYLLFEA